MCVEPLTSVNTSQTRCSSHTQKKTSKCQTPSSTLSSQATWTIEALQESSTGKFTSTIICLILSPVMFRALSTTVSSIRGLWGKGVVCTHAKLFCRSLAYLNTFTRSWRAAQCFHPPVSVRIPHSITLLLYVTRNLQKSY